MVVSLKNLSRMFSSRRLPITHGIAMAQLEKEGIVS
jgi:hypothetical protein